MRRKNDKKKGFHLRPTCRICNVSVQLNGQAKAAELPRDCAIAHTVAAVYVWGMQHTYSFLYGKNFYFAILGSNKNEKAN